jgi:hypothetical protein
VPIASPSCLVPGVELYHVDLFCPTGCEERVPTLHVPETPPTVTPIFAALDP